MIGATAGISWLLAALASWAAFGCSHEPVRRCPGFAVSGDLQAEALDCARVVRVESGRERGGVYRFHNSGTGVWIDGFGLVITANHVVNRKPLVAVLEADGRGAYTAEPIPELTREDLDVAVLRVVGRAEVVTEGGCALTRGSLPASFPRSRLANSSGSSPPVGSEVLLVGYPDEQFRVLTGRVIDPKEKLSRFIHENELAPYAGPEWAATGISVLAPDLPEGIGSLLDGLHAVRKRVESGFQFIELDCQGRQPGISGGAVVFRGEVVGVLIESWNSFEKTILIASPVWKVPLVSHSVEDR